VTAPVGSAEVVLDAFTVAVKVTGEFCVTLVADAANVVVVPMAPEFAVTLTGLEMDALKVLVPA